VGGIESLEHIDELRITHVLSALKGGDGDGEGDGECGGGGDSPRAPLVPSERASDGYPIVRWHVPVDDCEEADLLAHLPAAVQWLRMALRQPRARALVHCAQGVSRSAAVVAALFMAGRKVARAEDALALMRSGALPPGAADGLCPNAGFMAQLDLFGEMGWRVDEGCAAYRAYRAERAAAAFAAGALGGDDDDDDHADAYFARLPGEEEGLGGGQRKQDGGGGAQDDDGGGTRYRCRRCRQLLAGARNEVPADWVRGRRTFGRMGRHTPAYAAALAAAEAEELQLQQATTMGAQAAVPPSPDLTAAATATAEGAAAANTAPAAAVPLPAMTAPSAGSGGTVVFVEPMRWMRPQVAGGGASSAASGGSGKLYCPREGCPQRVGSFAWSGISSPSGAWVTPAFALHMARVDAVGGGGGGGGVGARAASGSGASVGEAGPAATLAAAAAGAAAVGAPAAAAAPVIRTPLLWGREARPPVVPVSRIVAKKQVTAAGGGGGASGGGAAEAATAGGGRPRS